MNRTFAALTVTAGVIGFMLVATAARAQSAAWADRGYFSVGADIRLASGGFTDVAHPIDFAEAAVVNTTYETHAAPGLDVGGGVRVWRNLGVGVNVSYVTKEVGGSVDAQVPHPLFFGRPRAVSGSATGLGRSETAVNLRAIWMMPVGVRWQVALAGGPSWFAVSQDLVQDVTLTQTYPYDTATYAGVVTERSSKSGVGFNAGVDAMYLFTRHLGVGVSATFSRAHVPLISSSSSSIGSDAGGLYVAGGLRVRF